MQPNKCSLRLLWQNSNSFKDSRIFNMDLKKSLIHSEARPQIELRAFIYKKFAVPGFFVIHDHRPI